MMTPNRSYVDVDFNTDIMLVENSFVILFDLMLPELFSGFFHVLEIKMAFNFLQFKISLHNSKKYFRDRTTSAFCV